MEMVGIAFISTISFDAAVAQAEVEVEAARDSDGQRDEIRTAIRDAEHR